MRPLAVLFCSLLLLAPPAFAADGNVYAAGGEVRAGHAIAGDFMAFGGRVVIDQPVKGDVTTAGGSVDIRAAVSDDVRVAGGNIDIEAPVGGELAAAGGTVTLTKQAAIAHGARIYAGTLKIDGRIDGPLEGAGQRVFINGEIRGDVRLEAEQVELGPAAKLLGSLSYASASALKKSDGASVAGTIRREPQRERSRDRAAMISVQSSFASTLVFYFGLLACAAVFLLIFPLFAPRASDRVGAAPLRTLAVGFATLVAVPVAAVLLFITLLGIPLGLATIAIYPILLLAGFLLGVLFIARLLPRALKREDPQNYAQSMGYVALALVALLLVTHVPFAGALAIGLVALAGLGAFVLEVFSLWGHRAAKPA